MIDYFLDLLICRLGEQSHQRTLKKPSTRTQDIASTLIVLSERYSHLALKFGLTKNVGKYNNAE